MVALKGAQITKFMQNPDSAIRAVLVYGPDNGLVKERVDKLIAHFITEEDKDFNLSILSDGELKDDPDILRDEAHANSLLGGNRAVLITDAGEALSKTLPNYLEAPNTECLIVARAGDLKPSSKLRSLFEKDKSSASLPCYSGDTRNLGEMINQVCTAHNLSIDPDARQHLISTIGSDFAVARMEVEKLCLYALKNKNITLSDVEDVFGDSSVTTLDTLVDSVMVGDLDDFDRAFDKIKSSGQAASTIILSLSRHLQKLHAIYLNMEAGLNSTEAMKRMRPPIHFKRHDSIAKQIRIWQGNDLLSAQSDLQLCEKETRQQQSLSDVITHRALLKLGYIARQKSQARMI